MHFCGFFVDVAWVVVAVGFFFCLRGKFGRLCIGVRWLWRFGGCGVAWVGRFLWALVGG